MWAWRANGELLDAVETSGCIPQLLPPVALHGKMVRVDDDISIIHSSNFNIRSTYYNTEEGVVVLDREFNRVLGNLIDDLIELTRCLHWNARTAGTPRTCLRSWTC